MLLAAGSLFCLARAFRFKLLRAPAILVNADSYVTNNAIVHAHATLELCNLPPGAVNLQQHEVAFVFMKNLVGKRPPAHAFSFGDSATLICSDLFQTLRQT